MSLFIKNTGVLYRPLFYVSARQILGWIWQPRCALRQNTFPSIKSAVNWTCFPDISTLQSFKFCSHCNQVDLDCRLTTWWRNLVTLATRLVRTRYIIVSGRCSCALHTRQLETPGDMIRYRNWLCSSIRISSFILTSLAISLPQFIYHFLPVSFCLSNTLMTAERPN